VKLGDAGLLTLAVSLCIFGILTVALTLSYAFSRRGRQKVVRRALVVFGSVGLLIPSVIGLASLGKWVPPDFVFYLWPTAFVLGAGENGDALWYIVLIFGVSILSNIGLCGLVGLLVGWVWGWIRAKPVRDASAH